MKMTFLRILTTEGTLEVSKDHLVATVNAKSETDFKFAKDLVVGDLLEHFKGLSKISSITTFTGVGVYAPLTYSGEMWVNNFRVSCYAYYESHHASHVIMSPMKLFRPSVNGVHWYPRLVQRIYNLLRR